MDKKIGEYIRDRRLAKGFKTQKMLSDYTGVSQATLSRIESGQQNPLPDTLATLSKFLDMNYSELMELAGYFNGLSDHAINGIYQFFDNHHRLDFELNAVIEALAGFSGDPTVFSAEITDLIEQESKAFRREKQICFAYTPGGIKNLLKELDPDEDFKTDLLAILNKVKHSISPQYHSATFPPLKIPIINKIQYGSSILDVANWNDQIQSPEGIKADFAARAEGESMLYAGIRSGDIILFRENSTPYSGQVIAARQLSETAGIILKYYIIKEGQAFLRSANPDYEDIQMTNDHTVLGVMVGLIRDTAPSLLDYELLLTAKTDNSERWAKTISYATTNGVSPESIQNMIEMHVSMLTKLANKNKEG